MSAHGPDRITTERAMSGKLVPQKIDDTLLARFHVRVALGPAPDGVGAEVPDAAEGLRWRLARVLTAPT